MKLCKRCIDQIKTHGEPIYVGPKVFCMDDVNYGETEQKCAWCNETDDLYDCIEKGEA